MTTRNGTTHERAAVRLVRCAVYSSPKHILMPKLLASRANWKAKAEDRRHQVKLFRLKVRDVTRSRDTWRQRYRDQREYSRRQDEQIEQLRRERDAALAAVAAAAAAPKK
jgi:hypothetical protein